MTATVHFFPQINDAPVTHISDIEPLVYESSETIKFLVARPAQEVCTSSKHCFNSLSPKSDQHQISPCNINAL